MGIDRPRLMPAYLLGAVAVLVAALVSLPYTETAAVKVTVPPQRLESNVSLNVATHHIEVQAAESQHATTNTTTVSPKYATGQVVFTLKCSTASPCQPTEHVPAGTIVSTTKGVGYATDFPAMFVGGGTAIVGVKAITPGTAGNSAAGTVTVIVTKHQAGLTVTNRDPIGGGADAHRGLAIQQSDMDALRTALAAKVTDDLAAAMQAKTPGMDFVVDSPPQLDATADHAVGDEVPVFTMTMTGRMGAVAFADSAAQVLMRSALEPLVPAGYELMRDPIQAHYLLQPAGENGSAIAADAVAFAAPKPSQQAFIYKLRGRSLRDANDQIQRYFPGSRVDIRQRPFAVPWLPFVAAHIDMTVIVEPTVSD